MKVEHLGLRHISDGCFRCFRVDGAVSMALVRSYDGGLYLVPAHEHWVNQFDPAHPVASRWCVYIRTERLNVERSVYDRPVRLARHIERAWSRRSAA